MVFDAQLEGTKIGNGKFPGKLLRGTCLGLKKLSEEDFRENFLLDCSEEKSQKKCPEELLVSVGEIFGRCQRLCGFPCRIIRLYIQELCHPS